MAPSKSPVTQRAAPRLLWAAAFRGWAAAAAWYHRTTAAWYHRPTVSFRWLSGSGIPSTISPTVSSYDFPFFLPFPSSAASLGGRSQYGLLHFGHTRGASS